MSDYQTAQQLAAEQVAYNAHIRAQDQAEQDAISYAEATAANGGFSPCYEDAPDGYYEAIALSRKAAKSVFYWAPEVAIDDDCPF